MVAIWRQYEQISKFEKETFNSSYEQFKVQVFTDFEDEKFLLKFDQAFSNTRRYTHRTWFKHPNGSQSFNLFNQKNPLNPSVAPVLIVPAAVNQIRTLSRI